MLLDYCNSLWSHGHYYAAVLAYMPAQLAIVFYHNIGVYFTLLIGANYKYADSNRRMD